MTDISKSSGGQDLKDIEQEMAEVEVLSEEEAKKLEIACKNNLMHSASKMHGIFAKGRSNYDSIVGSLSGGQPEERESPKKNKLEQEKKEDSEKQMMSMMLSPLQVKISKLKIDNDLANSKARSSEIQRYFHMLYVTSFSFYPLHLC